MQPQLFCISFLFLRCGVSINLFNCYCEGERLMWVLSYSKTSQKASHQWWESLWWIRWKGTEYSSRLVRWREWKKHDDRQRDKEQAINLSHREMWKLSAGDRRWYMTYSGTPRLLHTNKHNRTHRLNTHSHLTYHESRTSLSELTHVQQREEMHTQKHMHAHSHTLGQLIGPCSTDFTSNK